MSATVIPAHHANCFGCGPDNPAGLHLQMHHDGRRVHAQLTLDHRHEGSPGYAHGGTVAAALDDLFGGVLVMLVQPAVTAKLTVDYRAPVRLGRPLALTAWADRVQGRKLHLKATMHDDDRLVAEADARFLAVSMDHFASSGTPLPDDFATFARLSGQPAATPEEIA